MIITTIDESQPKAARVAGFAYLGRLSVGVSTDCTSECASWPSLHQKGALTMVNQPFNVRPVDDRKDWFK